MSNQAPSESHILLTGLVFGESPRWHGDHLYFSDMGVGEVHTLDLDGHHEVIAHVPTGVSGIGFLPDGHLLIVASREGRLVRRDPDGSLATHADLSAVAPSYWNDMVVDGRGNAYVNNLGFDFGNGAAFAPGSVALVTPDGVARQVADALAFPNGMAVTPDNATLIVGESYGDRLTAFDIAADGSLANRRVWASVPGDHPDGICVDAEGAVWYADVAGKHCVRLREGGEVLQNVQLDRGCFACVLGGGDRRTLFITAAQFTNAASLWGTRTGQVVAVAAPAAGAGWP